MAETRKTVTVVFSDVTGSTNLGEKLDPEALRRVMARYFEETKAALERHGGTVEKFIGDAVMAVFGIPELHEDDALRAVRAAAEMRDALAELNRELERERGVTLAVRTGVNTGEVVAGDPTGGEFYATGDAVNLAARLEQAAAPGEILVGETTYRLVRDTVRAEMADPLAAKGKAEAVRAWRLVEVPGDTPAFTRRIEAPFVGRGEELAALVRAFERVLGENACELATVVGPPGIGKSRLARELVRSVVMAPRVLVGRCLPYGDGITYSPLVEIVKQVAGDDATETLAKLLVEEEHADVIVSRIAAAVGLAETEARAEEISWAARLCRTLFHAEFWRRRRAIHSSSSRCSRWRVSAPTARRTSTSRRPCRPSSPYASIDFRPKSAPYSSGRLSKGGTFTGVPSSRFCPRANATPSNVTSSRSSARS